MPTKTEEKKEEKKGSEPWRYEHPKKHPDHNPPFVNVADPSKEAAKQEEDIQNAVLEKEHAKPDDEKKE